MLNRRECLKGSAVGLLTAALPGLRAETANGRALGVQLYTLRTIIDKDLHGTLAAVRAIGYRQVETYVAEYAMGARELRKAIEDAGLAVPSAHFGYIDFEARLDYCAELGAECAVCSMVPLNLARSGDDYKRAAAQYNRWAEAAQKRGLRFGFHNHNVEFVSYDGRTGLEILLAETDPARVGWQMDCYWVAQAGSDPVEMLRLHGSRVQSLHVKDRRPEATPTLTLGPESAFFSEVGTGSMNWTAILAEAEKHHVRYLFVEQDQTQRPPLESLAISYRNLRRLLK